MAAPLSMFLTLHRSKECTLKPLTEKLISSFSVLQAEAEGLLIIVMDGGKGDGRIVVRIENVENICGFHTTAQISVGRTNAANSVVTQPISADITVQADDSVRFHNRLPNIRDAVIICFRHRNLSWQQFLP